MRLLVVEDEPSLLRVVTKRLKEEGHSVDNTGDGREGLELAETTDYDCIVLDISLPSLDGLTILRRLRAQKKNDPVLLLTAKDAVSDRVMGLDLGADDYLTKPFSLDELSARIRALLRRQTESREVILSVADLTLDTTTHMASRRGEPIELTTKEYALLEYLMRNKNQVLTKSQIIDHVWDYAFSYNSNLVEVYIRYLRRKVDDRFESKLIHTVRGTGYVLREPK